MYFGGMYFGQVYDWSNAPIVVVTPPKMQVPKAEAHEINVSGKSLQQNTIGKADSR